MSSLKLYKIVVLTLILSAGLFTLEAGTVTQIPGSKEGTRVDSTVWIPVNAGNFTVNGLWWFKKNKGSFYRLPERVMGNRQLNPTALKYAYHPSGARVRFKTNSPALSLRVDHGGDKFSWKELSVMAMAGIEIYEGNPQNMIFRGISRPESGLKPYTVNFQLSPARELKEYTLYLPAYAQLKSLELSFEKGSVTAPPSAYKISKPVVFYGSSFIQGGCASRPSMNLPALTGRMLNADIINLGFAGDGSYEPEMADVLAEIDASCFVMGPILNDTGLMRNNYARFVARLRQKRPGCPILLMTRLQTLGQQKPFEVNDLVMKVYKDMKSSGDKNIYYFDSFPLYSDGSFHPTVEGLHPSDLGFMKIAEALAPEIGRALSPAVP